jgi:hypothetical protein
MNTYLKITNKGLIEAEDLTLVGSSTKRGVEGKIGEFGSGNKFSMAWYFRHGCVPVIMRGTEKLDVDVKVVLHRDTPVKVITVAGNDTSITTNMGPKWTGWMALRETISNAIDEGEMEIKVVVSPDFKGEENKTIYYIPMNDELNNVVDNFNHYFSMKRTPIFENNHGQIFSRSGDTFNLYRQGIRCYDDHNKINVDFNLYNIDINESRLTSEANFDSSAKKMIFEGVSERVMKLLLTSDYKDMLPGRFSENNLNVIRKMVANGDTFGSVAMAKMAGLLGTAGYTYVIDTRLYDQLIESCIIEGVQSKEQAKYKECDEHENIGEIRYFIKAFNIDLPLVCCITDRFDTCLWEDNRIMINIQACENKYLENKDIAYMIVKNLTNDYFANLIR